MIHCKGPGPFQMQPRCGPLLLRFCAALVLAVGVLAGLAALPASQTLWTTMALPQPLAQTHVPPPRHHLSTAVRATTQLPVRSQRTSGPRRASLHESDAHSKPRAVPIAWSWGLATATFPALVALVGLVLGGASLLRAALHRTPPVWAMMATADVEQPPPPSPSRKRRRRNKPKTIYAANSIGPEYESQLPPPTYPNFRWVVLQSGTAGAPAARLGLLTTPHGTVETPAFIFCATKACCKGMTPEMLREAGSQIILSNTYHLMLQPGSEIIKTLGGLQKTTGWRGPMLTDSGGYQIFSMGFGSVSSEIKGRHMTEDCGWKPSVQRINENGAEFRSYHDGSRQLLTPERSINVQQELGADLILVLDECTPFNVDKEYTAQSTRRSHRWAIRSLDEFVRGDDGTQALYGIIQGGTYPDLRMESIEFTNRQPFFGTAIGGSLGADKGMMHDVVATTAKHCRTDRPIHLLGIGGVTDIFHGVRYGIDTFDCVHPTRLGRHGGALVMAHYWEQEDPDARHFREHVHIPKARFRLDTRPIDETCGCYTCRNFSRGYLHHLFKAKEALGGTLVAIHNVYYMNRLMGAIREAIRNGTLDEEQRKWVYMPVDESP